MVSSQPMCVQIYFSVDEMRPFRLRAGVDLVQNVSLGISLNQISTEYNGYYCMLGIMLQTFPAPFASLSITAHKAHYKDTIFIL